jgi:hypothetical protein
MHWFPFLAAVEHTPASFFLIGLTLLGLGLLLKRWVG